jgi:hypothetical protein
LNAYLQIVSNQNRYLDPDQFKTDFNKFSLLSIYCLINKYGYYCIRIAYQCLLWSMAFSHEVEKMWAKMTYWKGK